MRSRHPALEGITSPSNWPGGVNNLQPAQIAQRSTWARVADRPTSLGELHLISMQRAGASTATILNPLDPGTVDEPCPDGGPGWLIRPGGSCVTVRAGRR